jgi:hypothetical protein
MMPRAFDIYFAGHVAASSDTLQTFTMTSGNVGRARPAFPQGFARTDKFRR